MPDAPEALTDLPIGKTSLARVDWLVLDRDNPRLIGSDPNASEVQVIADLYKGEELGELLQSIANNGYMDIEPLIVMERDGALVVLEGNRRLAAMRLFREPRLAEEIFQAERVRITVPPITPDVRGSLEQVSVYRVAKRDDARSFIGFKHINGAAKWDSYAKGKFAAQWYKSGDVSLQEIAGRIGDKHATIKRMVNAIYVLEQAENDGLFHIEDKYSPRFNFSHLYTALSRGPYMEFLGLDTSWSSFDPTTNPVDETHLPALKEVLIWIYGSKEADSLPIIQSQNPDIKRLGEVLMNAEGLAVIRAGGDLSDAHVSTQPASERFSEGLLRARSNMRDVSNSLRGFDGRDTSLVAIAEDITETSQTILDRMQKKVRAWATAAS